MKKKHREKKNVENYKNTDANQLDVCLLPISATSNDERSWLLFHLVGNASDNKLSLIELHTPKIVL